jgi:hypothetical protein
MELLRIEVNKPLNRARDCTGGGAGRGGVGWAGWAGGGWDGGGKGGQSAERTASPAARMHARKPKRAPKECTLSSAGPGPAHTHPSTSARACVGAWVGWG